MISDSQFNELKNQVLTLENEVKRLSREISRLLLKGDANNYNVSPVNNLSKKDTTKYRFEGKVYCKRRVVYACIKKYITDHNITAYQDLISVFPDYIQGSLGMIKTADEANLYSNAHRRFYFCDDDIVILDGKPHVICSQWEKKNIERFLKVAEKLGYEIEPISI
ncbi:hypothetical protein SAMN02910317_01222 [Ruminococcaceae bacterium FB2012]|nr:hypothetical protein SAMN02910317_01222 [Ruminococcaceae bacterium FB2012]